MLQYPILKKYIDATYRQETARQWQEQASLLPIKIVARQRQQTLLLLITHYSLRITSFRVAAHTPHAAAAAADEGNA